MLIFVLMRLVPGDIAEILVYQAGSETSGVQQKQIQQIREELGLERPVVIQYLSWIGGAVRGDFGKSYSQRRPVWDILQRALPSLDGAGHPHARHRAASGPSPSAWSRPSTRTGRSTTSRASRA